MPFESYNDAAGAYGYAPQELAARSQGLRILNPQTGVWQSPVAYERYRAGIGIDPGPLDLLKAVSDTANAAANIVNAFNGGQGTVAPPVMTVSDAPPAPAAGSNMYLMLGGLALVAILLLR